MPTLFAACGTDIPALIKFTNFRRCSSVYLLLG